MGRKDDGHEISGAYDLDIRKIDARQRFDEIDRLARKQLLVHPAGHDLGPVLSFPLVVADRAVCEVSDDGAGAVLDGIEGTRLPRPLRRVQQRPERQRHLPDFFPSRVPEHARLLIARSTRSP